MSPCGGNATENATVERNGKHGRLLRYAGCGAGRRQETGGRRPHVGGRWRRRMRPWPCVMCHCSQHRAARVKYSAARATHLPHPDPLSCARPLPARHHHVRRSDAHIHAAEGRQQGKQGKQGVSAGSCCLQPSRLQAHQRPPAPASAPAAAPVAAPAPAPAPAAPRRRHRQRAQHRYNERSISKCSCTLYCIYKCSC